MSDSIDFSRLSEAWQYWAPLAGLTNAQTSDAHPGHEIRFKSDDYSFHLTYNDGWWVIDTIDDRGQLHSGAAKFTTYDLVEKYLIWQWSSTSRNVLRLPRIGANLYSLGHNSDVQFIPIKEGIYELRIPEGRAVLMEPSATIFSHLMLKSVKEIQELVKP
ncbi:hypothetical protein [Mycobacterium sp. OAE908]|uniref:hypothetical protein n=1 Tax=Mycobacterium sp. OAE908 TaxID=2817899 RepID=UPI001AE2E6EE